MTLYKRCPCPPAARCDHPWWYAFKLHGRRYRGSTRATNRTLAERVAEKRRTTALEGREGIARPIAAPRLSEHVAAYLAWAEKDHPATATTKDTPVCASLQSFLRNRRLDDITAWDIERWRIVRGKQVGRSTVNREMHIVRGLFTKAVEWRSLAASPTKTVKQYRVDDARLRVLTDEEIARVLTGLPPRLALICRVTLECLPRLAEVLNLHRNDIGPDWIQIRRKGGTVARIPISAELRTLLVAHTDRRTGWVFGKSAAPPTPGAVSSLLTRAFRRLGLPGVSHHTMRHTGVTRMLEAGINPRVIQSFAGWTTLRMLERYGHTRDLEGRRAVEAMAAVVTTALAVPPPSIPVVALPVRKPTDHERDLCQSIFKP